MKTLQFYIALLLFLANPVAAEELRTIVQERFSEIAADGSFTQDRVYEKGDFKYAIRVEKKWRRKDHLAQRGLSASALANEENAELVRETEFVADHLIAKIKPAVNEVAMENYLTSIGAHIRKIIGKTDFYLIAFDGTDLEKQGQVQQALSQFFLYSESDYISHLQSTIPDDDYFASLIPDDDLFESDQWNMENIDAIEAWDITTDCSNVLVGVIGSGIDLDHEDLINNIWTNPGEIPDNGIDDDNNGYVDDVHGYDFYDDDNDPNDFHGHGTLVTGIIGAEGNNGVGIAGVCWNASLIALKMTNDEGSRASNSGVLEAIAYANAMGVAVTVQYWSRYGETQAEKDLIAEAADLNILYVVPAGDDDKDIDVFPVYPASYDSPNIISVAGTGYDDSLAFNGWWDSNYGATSVDLGAPGYYMMSTFPPDLDDDGVGYIPKQLQSADSNF